jgi:hypothetical protein
MEKPTLDDNARRRLARYFFEDSTFLGHLVSRPIPWQEK